MIITPRSFSLWSSILRKVISIILHLCIATWNIIYIYIYLSSLMLKRRKTIVLNYMNVYVNLMEDVMAVV